MIFDKNILVPLEITKKLSLHFRAELEFSTQPNQVYAKSLQGQSEIVFMNGNTYCGNLERGMMHGKGKFTLANGNSYEGDFRYNSIEGNGRMQYQNGDYYEGEVLQGRPHGEGELRFCGTIYRGSFRQGLKDGKGIYYQGTFKDDQLHGKGKVVYSTGNFYDGEWEMGMRHGYGEMHWLTTSQVYRGQWKNGMREGTGEHIWLDGYGLNKMLRNRYLGQWQSDIRQGAGAFFYASGTKYQGYWKDNKKDGPGLTTNENGSVNFVFNRLDKLEASHTKNQTAVNSAQKQISKRKEPGSKLVQIEPNIYSAMLALQDLNVPCKDVLFNVFLRNNSRLKQLYRTLRQKYKCERDQSFCLNLKGFWHFLKDSSAVSRLVTVSHVDRLFYCGAKNHFRMDFDQQYLKLKLQVAKSLGSFSQYEQQQLPWAAEVQRLTKNSINYQYSLCRKHTLNVHDPERLLLFRHFADAIYRTFSIKVAAKAYPCKDQPKLFQKFILKLTSCLDRGRQQSEGGERARQVPQFAIRLNSQLFNFCCSEVRLNFIEDKTVKLHKLFKLVEATVLVDLPGERVSVYSSAIRTLDKHGLAEGELIEKRGKRRLNQKHSLPGQLTAQFNKLLGVDLVQQQFSQLLYRIIAKVYFVQSQEAGERAKKYQSLVSKMLRVKSQPEYLPQYPPARVSRKDLLLRNLKAARERKDEEARAEQRRMAERVREEGERRQMQEWDWDARGQQSWESSSQQIQ